jgi:sugar/nucleoside kinase (ribokinase family)/fructoselysine-6-P-deglycase FrlB-like protein
VTDQPSGRRVVVVGNLTIDDVVLPDGRTSMGSLGGNAIYSVLAARMWTAAPGVVTRRGEDFPAEHLRALADLGVHVDGVVPVDGPTVRNWVLYAEDGSRTWVYRTPPERSAEVAVQPADVPAPWLAEDPAPVVHVAAMPLPAARAIVASVRAVCPGAVLTLDTHEDWVAGYEDELTALARQVDVFVPSREELALLASHDDPERAARDLVRAGVAAIVVKLGADGALVADADGVRSVAALEVEALDTTGAGDAFCGGLAAGLALGDALPEAVRRGCVSASFAVETFGSMSLAQVGSDDVAARWAGSAGGRAADAPPSEEGQYQIGVMLDEIAMIPDVIAEHLRDPRGAVQTIAELLQAEGIEHLFLTGCGDSAFAGAVTALAFRKHAGVDAEAVHALELSRYRVGYLPPRSAVVGISFSGKVGRTAEALVQAERAGHLTVALTNNPDSAVGRAAAHLLPIDVPTLGFSPGTSTYLGMVSTLLDLALRWGEARGHDTAGARAVVETLPKLASETLHANADVARSAAALLAGREWVSFLGAGPNEASARFGAAKLFEGPQIMGVATNTEEWAHEEYFVTAPGTPIVVVAPGGAGFSRAEEILAEMAFIGARAIVVSDRPVGDDVLLLPLAGGVPEEFSPVLCALPLSLVGFHLADILGKRSYNFASEEIRAEHYDTIHRLTLGDPA